MESALKNECIPFYEPAQALTVHCESAVTGKRFLKISGDKQDASFGLSGTADGGNILVEHADAGGYAIGVSNRNGAKDEKIGSYGPNFVVPVEAGEAISAGDPIAVGAGGKAVKAAGEAAVVGRAYADAEANKDVMVRIHTS